MHFIYDCLCRYDLGRFANDTLLPHCTGKSVSYVYILVSILIFAWAGLMLFGMIFPAKAESIPVFQEICGERVICRQLSLLTYTLKNAGD